MGNRTFDPSLKEELLERLASGEFISSIAKDERMPEARTIHRWANGQDEFAAELCAAREVGLEVGIERLVEEVRACPDPQKARVLADLLKWRAGKLSQGALRDRPLVGVQVNCGGDTDAFAAFTGALEEARTARASLADRTTRVVTEGEARTGDSAG